MRTLILTSEGRKVIDKVVKLLPAPPGMLKLAFIDTAKNHLPDKEAEYATKDKKMLAELGFEISTLDLANKTEEEVREALRDVDVIYAEGGNTYVLLKAMQECQFTGIVRELLDKGVIYIGSSAGSIVASPDIQVSSWLGTSENIANLTDFTGLYLVPFGIFPHYTGHFSEEVGKEIVKAPYKVKFLRDDQLLFIHGDKVSEF